MRVDSVSSSIGRRHPAIYFYVLIVYFDLRSKKNMNKQIAFLVYRHLLKSPGKGSKQIPVVIDSLQNQQGKIKKCS